MKICIIGNSHIACVKKAWDEMSLSGSYPHQVTFFGSHADTLLNTESNSTGLFPKNDQVRKSFILTSGGEESVIFNKYDLFFLHGFSPSFRNYHSLYNYFDLRFASSGFKKDSFMNISDTMSKLLKHMMNTQKPVFVTPRPSKAVDDYEKVLDSDKVDNEVYEKVLAYIENGFKNIGFKYLHQPEETLIYNNFTKKEYNTSGIGLGEVPKKDNDHILSSKNLTHMNKAYGKVYLEDIFRNL